MRSLNQNKWQWGKDAFYRSEDFPLFMPSFSDITIEDRGQIQHGVIGDSLSVISNNKNTILNPGEYSLNGYKNQIYPSESLSTILSPNVTSLNLPFLPSNSHMPSLSTYKVVNGKIQPDRKWLYTPYDMYDDHVNGFKIDDDNNLIIKLSAHKSYSSVIIYPIAEIEGVKIFQLPEFPFKNLIVSNGLNNSTIYEDIGLIYTTDSHASLTVSFNSVPLFTYVPKYTISNEVFLSDKLNAPETFISFTLDLLDNNE